MKMKMFTIYDTKGQFFSQPFIGATSAAGMRMFGDLVNNPQTMFHAHPKDYELYEIGYFDDQTAEMEKGAANVRLANGMDLSSQTPDYNPSNNGKKVEVVN